MEMNAPRAAGFIGASAAIGAGFAAAGNGMRSPKGIALGIATGVAAGAAYTLVTSRGGVEELALGASMLGGAGAGALMLRGLAGSSLTPMAQRGVGAALGAVVGLLGPVAVGAVLARVQPD